MKCACVLKPKMRASSKACCMRSTPMPRWFAARMRSSRLWMPICSFVQPRRRSMASRLGVTASGRVSTTRPTQRCSADSLLRCRTSSWENVAVCHCAAAAQPLRGAASCESSGSAFCVSLIVAQFARALSVAALRSSVWARKRESPARVPQAYRFRTVSL